ncbi:MAG: glycosyltransferase family 4 protein [Phocaeicola sp.]
MKIAIEAQRIFRKNKHGMDFVVLESIRELQRVDKTNTYYIFVGPGPDKCLDSTPNFHIKELNYSNYLFWEQWALPRAVAHLKPDLLHCTSNTAPMLGSTPLVLTLHDIIFLEKRAGNNNSWYQALGWYYRKFVVPMILPKCKRVITVSQFEFNNIEQRLDLKEGVLQTIYNGYNSHFTQMTPDPNIVQKYINKGDYLLFLGNTDPKKNAVRVLKAYSIYLQQSLIKRPFLIGDLKEEFIDSILEKEGIEFIKPYLAFPGYIDNKDLVHLYNGAFAFLYPSLRESFGIPMLEAMACGTPLIASNSSSMPEIAGESGLLINPYNEKEIAKALLDLENDSQFYQTQISNGLERVKNFSWKYTAEELLKLYQAIE